MPPVIGIILYAFDCPWGVSLTIWLASWAETAPCSSRQDPASAINAAVAVACLVGHEENNAKLQLDEDLVGKMLEVLGAACQVREQQDVGLRPHGS